MWEPFLIPFLVVIQRVPIYRKMGVTSMTFGMSPSNPTKGFLTLPLGRIPRSTHASLKLRKNPMGKNVEKEYMIVVLCIALVASLKTLCEKLQENSLRKK